MLRIFSPEKSDGFSRVYFLVFTRQCVRLVVFQVLLCKSEREVVPLITHERTFLR